MVSFLENLNSSENFHMLPKEIIPLFPFLISLVAAVYIIPNLSRIARSIGLLDRPGEKRKVHSVARPLVGGIGMLFSALFSVMLFSDTSHFHGLFFGLALLLVTGFVDDFRELDPKRKFCVQIVAALFIIFFDNTTLTSFGNLLATGAINLPPAAIIIWPITIFCVVGVINALNLMDGMDGLAGGISFIIFIFYTIHAINGGQTNLALLNLAFAGAVLGFLHFNWSPAVVFMGDSGSLCLGFVLAFMSLKLTQGPHACMSPIIALISLSIPITDTITVMTKRLLRKRNPFLADQQHLHHILMRCGMDRVNVVKTILAATVLVNIAGLAISTSNWPDWVPFLLYFTFLVLYFAVSLLIHHAMRISLRYQKNHAQQENKGTIELLARRGLDKVDLLRIFRKERRYWVELPVTVTLLNGEKLQGTLENFSLKGCMLALPQLTTLQNQVQICLELPFGDKKSPLKLGAEHLWRSSEEGEESIKHGFKFTPIGEEEKKQLCEFFAIENHSSPDEKRQTFLGR
jgi:UDP-GlcNAc:undecaprenyl-phosphate GlcNAc-1-phosphate transferase